MEVSHVRYELDMKDACKPSFKRSLILSDIQKVFQYFLDLGKKNLKKISPETLSFLYCRDLDVPLLVHEETGSAESFTVLVLEKKLL